ncbi:MAG: hypothetical protein HY691_10825 [Chloroflexi bacterium]|nr:hypothetical protein [Chloroflexota bacterium]
MLGRAQREDALSATGVPWPAVWAALSAGVAGTVVVGGALFLLDRNVWWVALGGTLALFAAAAYVGWRSAEAEPLHGTIVVVLYFALVVAILFGGTLIEVLPEPLPGLDIGDSTFFFVWPLLLLAAGVAGCLLGGRLAAGRRRP